MPQQIVFPRGSSEATFRPLAHVLWIHTSMLAFVASQGFWTEFAPKHAWSPKTGGPRCHRNITEHAKEEGSSF
ncbi:hypothetical protein BTUL_0163g00170 [Botrytis tulipae]|uniref:Uncharacterized protein n=1 Tax=Botrytis tulipae TaxID=87230 RepID=A0A4Z1EKH8_9HELO|nr:hypothetical protein BTUL_0163g00170 [Botrytis tulipae]